MSLQALTTAATLYRGTSLTLEQAATHTGLTADELAKHLRSQGIPTGEDASSPEAISD
ncbi:hypothetical protein [Halobaculum marinum]|uniref:Translation initiation factor IF-2 N-terminal domain-containing protein n=1 Tax=Halobaculum marinum TaxID=3031996 RepID=A0ABD5WUL7_9EURY|nr:hypothetical protein [Halobaculum sp. DT55]